MAIVVLVAGACSSAGSPEGGEPSGATATPAGPSVAASDDATHPTIQPSPPASPRSGRSPWMILSASRPPADLALPYPDGCAAYWLTDRRCAAIVAWAREQAGLGPGDQATAWLLGDPDSGVTRLGGSLVVRVRLTAPDGTWSDVPLFCGLGSDTLLICADPPRVRISSPTADGYRDIPCSGPAPGNPCATPLPTLDPAAIAAAIPFELTALEIPIDHAGTYLLDLGEAVLPNGVLTQAAISLPDDHPADIVMAPDGVRLDVASLDGGPPFNNLYLHGWRTGTERVAVRLSFTVESFEPGAVLHLVGILVR